MKRAIEASGMFFQMGFMRRFDPGYAAAKKQIDAGRIGTPLVFKATSRDPFRPSLEYANPKSSGGMLIDMGIHDFDLARWFMGDVRSVAAIGATIAYPELATVGDIDNAIASLTFASGKLGVVDLTRSGIYGYDISTEILGLEGTIRIGYLRETPIVVMTKANWRLARHGAVLHGTLPRRVHQPTAEFRAERAAAAPGADHDRRWPGGSARWRRGNARTADRHDGKHRGRADVELTLSGQTRAPLVSLLRQALARPLRPSAIGRELALERAIVEHLRHDRPGVRAPVRAGAAVLGALRFQGQRAIDVAAFEQLAATHHQHHPLDDCFLLLELESDLMAFDEHDPYAADVAE